VLTYTHIFLFHEDVESNFCRTLASAQLTDLVSVHLDPGAQIYMILVGFMIAALPLKRLL